MLDLSPAGRLTPSERLTYAAFAMVMLFTISQIAWWMIFQQRYVRQVMQTQATQWQHDAELVNEVLQAAPERAPALLARHPHLRWNTSANIPRLEVDPLQLAHFEQQQRGYLRMFAYEAPVFIVVMLAGLYIIYLKWQAERTLKRQQQNFLNAVSHEFKTPLSTLKLLVQSIQRPRTPEEKRRYYLNQLSNELARLEATSQHVLAAARLEQGSSPPQLRQHDLNTVVRTIITPLQAGLEARGAQLSLSYTAQPLPVSLDADAFGVVLRNLLDNAVKYSPQAVKPINLRLEAQAHLVHLHVEDAGQGISERELKHIFSRFYRIGNELRRQQPGVGLGLYLVKHITEAMHGWVEVTRLEPGTRFTLTFPKRVSVPYCQQLQAQSGEHATAALGIESAGA